MSLVTIIVNFTRRVAAENNALRADIRRLETANANLQAELTRWTDRVTKLEAWAVENDYDGSNTESETQE
ncbi:MAG: hypothetical protein IJU65_04255 [Desulfovibrio sp.]|nr:hypothetical protein [Desulfovibrio sp.]